MNSPLRHMSLFELAAFVFENLNRRKGRVALTAIGVIIGTAAVVVLVSLAIGLQRNANQQLYGIGDLSQIQVSPGYNEMGGGSGVMRVEMSGPGDMPEMTLITDESLAQFAAIPGVEAVVARDWMMGSAILRAGRSEQWINLIGLGTNDLGQLGLRAQQGTMQLERGTMIVGYSVTQGFYDPSVRPGQEQPPQPDLLNSPIKLTLIKWTEDGEVRRDIQIRVVGIIAETRSEPDWSAYMSIEDITAINEWVMGRRINRSRDGYQLAIVKVQDPRNVLEIADVIKGMGYQAYAPQEMVQNINNFFIILQVIFGGVGAIALLVAAIGIANTMAMAVLERTREIGLLKAVGATNRDVLSVFLGEAAGIGLLGGIGGIVLGWSAGQVVNVLALAFLAGQAAQTGAPPPSAAVITPPWLPIFALVFATLIGLLSGVYPALRAATLIPVDALKYE